MSGLDMCRYLFIQRSSRKPPASLKKSELGGEHIWIFKLKVKQNMQVYVSKCAKSKEKFSVSTYGQDLDFASIPEDSSQDIAHGDCRVV